MDNKDKAHQLVANALKGALLVIAALAAGAPLVVIVYCGLGFEAAVVAAVATAVIIALPSGWGDNATETAFDWMLTTWATALLGFAVLVTVESAQSAIALYR